MKVKIISDGSPDGTRVVDAETGEEVGQVVAVEWRHVGGEPPTAEITLLCPEVELEGEVRA